MGEIQTLCRKVYVETIEQAEINTELKRALRTHERVPVFIDNLARDFSKLSMRVKRETIELAARDMTYIFIRAVDEKAKQAVMSDIAKMLVRKEHDDLEEFRRTAEILENQGVENVTEEKGLETSRQEIKV